MSKREVIMDWLDQKENRDKLEFANVTKSQYEAFDYYGEVLHYPETDVVYLGKRFFRIKNKGE